MTYEVETLGPEDDDGTMPENVAKLTEAVVGHRIVSAEQAPVGAALFGAPLHSLKLTLDNGREVTLHATDDCCAYTTVESFLLDPASVDHIITGVGTTVGYTTWHIYADYGDILKLEVDWSPGNPFYYGYGFSIQVVDKASDLGTTRGGRTDDA